MYGEIRNQKGSYAGIIHHAARWQRLCWFTGRERCENYFKKIEAPRLSNVQLSDCWPGVNPSGTTTLI